MTNLARFALIAAVAACAAQTPRAEELSESTLTFDPASIALVRFPACSESPANPEPGYGDDDKFVLALTGAQTPTERPAQITVSFSIFMVLGAITAIQLDPFGTLSNVDPAIPNGQRGTLPGGNAFLWVQDTDRSQLDATPIKAAGINPHDVPSADGDVGEVTLYLEFDDGGIYDAEFTAKVASAPCP